MYWQFQALSPVSTFELIYNVLYFFCMVLLLLLPKLHAEFLFTCWKCRNVNLTMCTFIIEICWLWDWWYSSKRERFTINTILFVLNKKKIHTKTDWMKRNHDFLNLSHDEKYLTSSVVEIWYFNKKLYDSVFILHFS